MPMHYKHSGKFSALLPFGFLLMTAIAFILSYIYVYLVFLIPFTGYVTFILIAGLGIAVGFSSAFILNTLKTRNNIIATLTGIALGLITVYFSWVSFIHIYTGDFAKVQMPLLDIFMKPGLMWTLICGIAEKGWFSIKGGTPSGVILWIMWGIEAVAIALTITLFCSFSVLNEVFCETCGKWTDKRDPLLLFKFKESYDNQIELFERQQPDFLETIEPIKPYGDKNYFSISSNRCNECNELHTISLNSISSSWDDNGEEKENKETIISNMFVSKDFFELLSTKKFIKKENPEYPIPPEPSKRIKYKTS